jgi:hypothetical protein
MYASSAKWITVSPATVSQVDTLAQTVQQLASKVGLLGRRP